MNNFNFINGGHPNALNDYAFMQSAYQLGIANSGLVNKPESVNSYIVSGCQITKSGTSYTHTAGVIYLNNQFYQVDELTIPLTDAGVPVWGIEETVDTTLNYSDGSAQQPYRIRKGKLYINTYPDGIIDINTINHSKNYIHKPYELKNFVGTQAQLTDYFTAGVGIDGTAWEGFYLCNGQTVNGQVLPDMRGRVSLGFQDVAGGDDLLRDNNYTTLLSLGGTKKHTLTIDEIPAHDHEYQQMLRNGGAIADSGSGSQNNTATSGQTGGDQPHENRQPYIVVYPTIRLPYETIITV